RRSVETPDCDVEKRSRVRKPATGPHTPMVCGGPRSRGRTGRTVRAESTNRFTAHIRRVRHPRKTPRQRHCRAREERALTNTIGSTVLGYPRIGPNRELKRALESYWKSNSSEADLRETARKLRTDTWHTLRDAGLKSIPSNTFSYYDQVLDTAATFGAVPPRYSQLGLGPLDTYFAMARGIDSTPPLEMTKWFDTNYHYLVPEIGPTTRFSLADRTPVEEFREARELGIETRPVLVGPLTFLLLSKQDADSPRDFRPLNKLDELLEAYVTLLDELHQAGAEWVQLDEPAFAADRTQEELDQLRVAYRKLGELTNRPNILASGYFGDLGDGVDGLA